MFKIKNYTNQIKFVHEETYVSSRDEQHLVKNNFKNRDISKLEKKGRRDCQEYCKKMNTTVKAKQFINSFIEKKYMQEDLKIEDYKSAVIELLKHTDKDTNQLLNVFHSILKQNIPTALHYSDGMASPFTHELIHTFFRAIHKLETGNKWKRELLEEEDRRIKNIGDLTKRRSRRFKPFYKNCFFKPVFNKEGDPIEGTCVNDSSLYVNVELVPLIKYYKNEKEVCQWRVIFEYGDGSSNENKHELFITQDWKNNVGRENIAVADKKIILKAKIIDTNPIQSIPCTTFEVTWLQRSRVQNRYGLVQKKGFLVRVGDKENPIAIRATEHLSQVNKIAQNTATRIFFQKLAG